MTCKRGHDNWKTDHRGRRFCKTCQSDRAREWRERNELADYQRGRRAAITELREWLDEPAQYYAAIERGKLISKLNQMEEA